MTPPLVTPEMPVLIQGVTGRAGRRHTVLMHDYGTNIVAGVSPAPTRGHRRHPGLRNLRRVGRRDGRDRERRHRAPDGGRDAVFEARCGFRCS